MTSWQRLRDLLEQAGRDGPRRSTRRRASRSAARRASRPWSSDSTPRPARPSSPTSRSSTPATSESLKTRPGPGRGRRRASSRRRSTRSAGGRPGHRKPPQDRGADPADHRPDHELLEAYNYFLSGREEYEKFYFAGGPEVPGKGGRARPGIRHRLPSSVSRPDLAPISTPGTRPWKKPGNTRPRRARRKGSTSRRQYADGSSRTRKNASPPRRARRKVPGRNTPTSSWGRLSRRRRLSKLLSAIGKAIALDPEFGLAINHLAYVHARPGKFDEAIKDFERYAALIPGDANPLDSIGRALMREGKLDDPRPNTERSWP